MTDCEICGKKAPKPIEIVVDSAKFKVCKTCSDFGIAVRRAAIAYKKVSTPYATPTGPEFNINPEFAKIIRDARAMCNMNKGECVIFCDHFHRPGNTYIENV